MPNELTIAMAQVESTPSPAENLKTAERLVRQAADRGADMLVFPEMFMGLPNPERPPAEIVAEDGGRFLDSLTSLAESNGIYITSGCWEARSDGNGVYNAAVTLSPGGRIIASYRKLHLFDALNIRESDTTVAGDTLPPIVDVAGIQVGFAICYDLRFPELFRYLAKQGAQAVVVPAAWYQGPVKEDHWQTLLRARAIENVFYVVGCNLVGPAFCGRSGLFDPFGIQVCGAGEVETFIMGHISADRIASVRRKLPALEHNRLSISQPRIL